MENKQDVYWEDSPKFGKLKGTDGKLKLCHVRWRGIHGVDLRVLRRTDDGYQYTRGGVRITYKQLQEIIPQLVLISNAIQNEMEEARRIEENKKPVDDSKL